MREILLVLALVAICLAFAGFAVLVAFLLELALAGVRRLARGRRL